MVDLPLPEGPRIETKSPVSTRKFTPRKCFHWDFAQHVSFFYVDCFDDWSF